MDEPLALDESDPFVLSGLVNRDLRNEVRGVGEAAQGHREKLRREGGRVTRHLEVHGGAALRTKVEGELSAGVARSMEQTFFAGDVDHLITAKTSLSTECAPRTTLTRVAVADRGTQNG